jgi:hypothetical protein
MYVDFLLRHGSHKRRKMPKQPDDAENVGNGCGHYSTMKLEYVPSSALVSQLIIMCHRAFLRTQNL